MNNEETPDIGAPPAGFDALRAEELLRHLGLPAAEVKVVSIGFDNKEPGAAAAKDSACGFCGEVHPPADDEEEPDSATSDNPFEGLLGYLEKNLQSFLAAEGREARFRAAADELIDAVEDVDLPEAERIEWVAWGHASGSEGFTIRDSSGRLLRNGDELAQHLTSAAVIRTVEAMAGAQLKLLEMARRLRDQGR